MLAAYRTLFSGDDWSQKSTMIYQLNGSMFNMVYLSLIGSQLNQNLLAD